MHFTEVHEFSVHVFSDLFLHSSRIRESFYLFNSHDEPLKQHQCAILFFLKVQPVQQHIHNTRKEMNPW